MIKATVCMFITYKLDSVARWNNSPPGRQHFGLVVRKIGMGLGCVASYASAQKAESAYFAGPSTWNSLPACATNIYWPSRTILQTVEITSAYVRVLTNFYRCSATLVVFVCCMTAHCKFLMMMMMITAELPKHCCLRQYNIYETYRPTFMLIT